MIPNRGDSMEQEHKTHVAIERHSNSRVHSTRTASGGVLVRTRINTPQRNNSQVVRRIPLGESAQQVLVDRVSAMRIATINLTSLRQVVTGALQAVDIGRFEVASPDQIIEISGAVTKEVMKIISEETREHPRGEVITAERIEKIRDADPLASARERGTQSKRRLLEAEGGTLSALEVADLLGLRRQSVDKRRQKGLLIGLNVERRGYRYPKWQFTNDGLVLEGLPSILTTLKSQGPWVQTAYMLNRNTRLDGERPLDLLRAGQFERVLEAASNYGEHSAI